MYNYALRLESIKSFRRGSGFLCLVCGIVETALMWFGLWSPPLLFWFFAGTYFGARVTQRKLEGLK